MRVHQQMLRLLATVVLYLLHVCFVDGLIQAYNAHLFDRFSLPISSSPSHLVRIFPGDACALATKEAHLSVHRNGHVSLLRRLLCGSSAMSDGPPPLPSQRARRTPSEWCRLNEPSETGVRKASLACTVPTCVHGARSGPRECVGET